MPCHAILCYAMPFYAVLCCAAYSRHLFPSPNSNFFLSNPSLLAVRRCRRQFSFTSVLRKDLMEGSIPPCLFDTASLPALRTLHLSGNGFTGTLPHNFLRNGSSLLEMELGHNR